MLRTRSESHESLMTQIKKTYRDSHKNLKQAQLNLDAAIQNVNEARMLVASSFDLLDYFTKYKNPLYCRLTDWCPGDEHITYKKFKHINFKSTNCKTCKKIWETFDYDIYDLYDPDIYISVIR